MRNFTTLSRFVSESLSDSESTKAAPAGPETAFAPSLGYGRRGSRSLGIAS